jgi:hypothetical protein
MHMVKKLSKIGIILTKATTLFLQNFPFKQHYENLEDKAFVYMAQAGAGAPK